MKKRISHNTQNLFNSSKEIEIIDTKRKLKKFLNEINNTNNNEK